MVARPAGGSFLWPTDRNPNREIVIRGAKEHNLKNIDLRLPRDSLIVMTGPVRLGQVVAGLRHDLCRGAAALCRESLSAYARQFLEMMQKPDVEQIEGLSPAISIEQKTTVAQSALDRRHGHRDLRLSAPAVRARRHPLFAGHRPADPEPDRVADGRHRHGAARRRRGSTCWRRSRAAARASTSANSTT